jgi:chromosome partitioning protein
MAFTWRRAVAQSDDELIGLFEVADLAGVSRTVVSNWRTRDPQFPEAVAELRSGPVFRTTQITKYLKRRKAHMGYVVSTINLKGGVGKTTTTVALAELLSGEFHKKVLVIDLDPQTNLTTVLIGEDKWKDLNDAGYTLATLFKDALRSEDEEPEFDLAKTLQRRVSPVDAVRSVDLLPSSLDLIDVQDRLGTMSSGRFFSRNPTDLLRRAIKDVLSKYDFVLVDCPPNLGLITLNGLRISDAYVIPTIPDVLSTYGIPQIQGRVRLFADDVGESIEELGIIVSKYRAASTVHQNTVQRMLDDEDLPPVFDSIIPEANQIAASAEFQHYGTLRQRYGYQGQFDAYRALAKEFIDAIEELR